MNFPCTMPFSLAMLPTDGFATGQMCPELWFCHHKDVVQRCFAELLKAGAQTIVAPTFGANPLALSSYNLEDSSDEINSRLLLLSQDVAAPFDIPVGAVIGPSGYSSFVDSEHFEEIYESYRTQIKTLLRSGADFLLLSQQVSIADMRAALLASRTEDIPVLATLKTDASGITPHGCSLLSALITLQAMGLDAFGVESSELSLSETENLLNKIQPHTQIPLATVINNINNTNDFSSLLNSGVRIWGLNSNSPQAMENLVSNLSNVTKFQNSYENADCYAATIEEEAFFLGETLEFSEPLICSSRLSDELIDIENDSANVTLVRLDVPVDADILAKAAVMARRPIAVQTDSLPVLEAALRYFPGRLIVDSNCSLDEDSLSPLTAKYGAILY